jgi:hypothetical protein
MTTTLNTSCSENTMVLSARRGFLHAFIFLFLEAYIPNGITSDHLKYGRVTIIHASSPLYTRIIDREQKTKFIQICSQNPYS